MPMLTSPEMEEGEGVSEAQELLPLESPGTVLRQLVPVDPSPFHPEHAPKELHTLPSFTAVHCEIGGFIGLKACLLHSGAINFYPLRMAAFSHIHLWVEVLCSGSEPWSRLTFPCNSPPQPQLDQS